MKCAFARLSVCWFAAVALRSVSRRHVWSLTRPRNTRFRRSKIRTETNGCLNSVASVFHLYTGCRFTKVCIVSLDCFHWFFLLTSTYKIYHSGLVISIYFYVCKFQYIHILTNVLLSSFSPDRPSSSCSDATCSLGTPGVWCHTVTPSSPRNNQQ